MTRDRQPLPVYVRLALRDLKQNLLGSLVLTVILGITIALTLPGLIGSYQAPYSQRVHYQVHPDNKNVLPFSTSTQSADNTAVQAVVFEAQQPEKIKDSMKSVGLETQEVSHSEINIPEVPNPETQFLNATLGASEDQDSFRPQVSNADWSDSRLTSTITMVEGTFPRTAQEIALNVQTLVPFAATPEGQTMEDAQAVEAAKTFVSTAQTTLAVGNSVRVEMGDSSTTLKVVGWYSSEDFPSAIGATTSFDNSAVFTSHDLRGYGPALSDDQALSLARAFSNEQQFAWVDWGIRNLSNNPTLAERAAFSIPFNQFEREDNRYSSEPSLQTALVLGGVVALISIPLHWQNRRRRSEELTQLNRAGMSGRQQVATQFIPAIAIGLGAATIGLALGLILIDPISTFWAQDLMPLTSGNSLLIAVGIALGLGVIPTIFASTIPQVLSQIAVHAEGNDEELASTTRAARNGSYATTGSATAGKEQDASRFRRLALPIALLALGLLIACLTAKGNSFFAPGAYCVAAGLLLIGSHYWFSRLFDVLSTAAANKRVSLRIATRELSLQRVSSINAAIAITLISTLGVAIAMIFRQHAIEYGPAWGYNKVALLVASASAILLLAIMYFISLRGSHELRNLRSPLAQQGVDDSQLRRIDGHRTLILAVVGCATGYVLGTGIAAAVLIGRVNNSSSPGIEPLALLPNAASLIVVFVPIAAAFYIGQLAGQRNLALTQAGEQEFASAH